MHSLRTLDISVQCNISYTRSHHANEQMPMNSGASTEAWYHYTPCNEVMGGIWIHPVRLSVR